MCNIGIDFRISAFFESLKIEKIDKQIDFYQTRYTLH